MNYIEKCQYKEIRDPKLGPCYVFTGPCIVTQKPYSVTVPVKELEAYYEGAFIQDALKSVNKDDREFIISGASPEGFNQLFPPEEG